MRSRLLALVHGVLGHRRPVVGHELEREQVPACVGDRKDGPGRPPGGPCSSRSSAGQRSRLEEAPRRSASWTSRRCGISFTPVGLELGETAPSVPVVADRVTRSSFTWYCYLATGVPDSRTSRKPGGARRLRRRGGARGLLREPPSGSGLLQLDGCRPTSSILLLDRPRPPSFSTPSLRGLGAPSTRSLASLRPRPVISRTTLMTWIFLSPAPKSG